MSNKKNNLNRELKLSKISYSYDTSSRRVLEDILCQFLLKQLLEL